MPAWVLADCPVSLVMYLSYPMRRQQPDLQRLLGRWVGTGQDFGINLTWIKITVYPYSNQAAFNSYLINPERFLDWLR